MGRIVVGIWAEVSVDADHERDQDMLEQLVH